MAAFATISGTMLTPGVSRNNRLYTAELIGRAVERMNGRIADPDAPPIVMRTHHDAGDNTRQIVGRVTAVAVDTEGNATYQANIYNTSAGRDLIGLIEGPSPALRNTSIFGYWEGVVRQVEQDGVKVETGEDIEIEAIDFTAFPGVLDARISNVQTGTPRESAAGRRAVVTESLEPPVLEHVEPEAATEKDTKPYGDVTYADPGYQSDKVKRYPLDTKAHVRSAWSYINQKKNAAKYSADDLAKIKGRIIAAAKKLGINISKETGELEDPIYEAKLGPVTECWDCDGNVIGFAITMWNGPLTVSVSANSGIADGDLPLIATAAMNAACDAVCAMDPDVDADFDIAGAPGSSGDEPVSASVPDDNNMESAAPATETEPAPEPVPVPAPEIEPEPEPPEESTAPDLPPVNITPKQLAERLARRKATPTPVKPTPVLPAQLSTPVADQATETTTTAPAGESREGDEESAMADTETTTPAAEQAASTTEPKSPAAEEAKAPARTLTDEDVKALAGALKPAPAEEAKSEEPAATETAKPARTMAEEDVKALAMAIGAALGESLRGVIPQPGAAVTESTEQVETPAQPQAEPATETTDASPAAEQVNATESTDMKVAIGEAVSRAVKEAIPTILDTYGLPRRRGFRTSAESTEEMTRDELWANRADVLLGGYGKPPTA